jgi:predicted ferric reductase
MTSSGTVEALPRSARRAPRPRPWAVDVLAAAGGLGLGATLALGIAAETSGSLSAPGGLLTFAGRLTGLVGAYALLIAVLLAARIPALERALGQDRLVGLHRRLAPWALGLIAAHGILLAGGYAQRANTGVAAEAWTMLTTLPGVLAATAGFGLLALAGITSYRAARRRMAHETWWAVHLYTYLGLALAFSHQLSTGASFVGHPVARTFWTVLWLGTAGTVLAYRVALPAWRSLRHSLRVQGVFEEAPGVYSVVVSGRSLHRLPLSGGQFLLWRFLVPGLWWQAHPYSVSALPSSDRMRVTVKDLGDHSRALTRLRPGTRIAVEGPYGAFTADHAVEERALIIAGGVGITPVRSLLEDLAQDSRPIVVLRARRPGDLVHADEIEALARARGGRLETLIGPREDHLIDGALLRALAPDLDRRDIYVCGPPGLMRQVVRAARQASVPATRLHYETFDLLSPETTP